MRELQTPERAGWAAALLCALPGLAAAPLLAAAPPAEGPVLAVAPPWRSAEAVAAAAGGWPVGPAVGRLGVLATGQGPDFPARLRAAGAWAVLNPAFAFGLCATPDGDSGRGAGT